MRRQNRERQFILRAQARSETSSDIWRQYAHGVLRHGKHIGDVVPAVQRSPGSCRRPLSDRCLPKSLDPDTAKRVTAANNPERIRQEIDWSQQQSHHHADVTAQSRWQPSGRPQWPRSDDDLSIPEFLKRGPGS